MSGESPHRVQVGFLHLLENCRGRGQRLPVSALSLGEDRSKARDAFRAERRYHNEAVRVMSAETVRRFASGAADRETHGDRLYDLVGRGFPRCSLTQPENRSPTNAIWHIIPHRKKEI